MMSDIYSVYFSRTAGEFDDVSCVLCRTVSFTCRFVLLYLLAARMNSGFVDILFYFVSEFDCFVG